MSYGIFILFNNFIFFSNNGTKFRYNIIRAYTHKLINNRKDKKVVTKTFYKNDFIFVYLIILYKFSSMELALKNTDKDINSAGVVGDLVI